MAGNRAAGPGPGAAYERHKARSAAAQAEQALAGRDIGDIPPVADPARREGGGRDLRRFCLDYFPWTFSLAFSADHLRVIGKAEKAVLEGGLFALAMPRGSGKTSLAECACLWALLYGHRSFVVLIGSDLGAAERSLDSLKVELETNELLQADFPEVCYPIQRLERIANRCKGQLYRGQPTYVTWTADTLVLPSVPGSAAAGGVVKVAGLTGSIRGLKHKRADGRAARPDLVVIDDPQTDDSARSASQCAYRERVLAGAVLGLAGPGKKISGIMPCTVIAPGDVADRMLDQGLHPRWGGERTKLLYALPARLDLWEEYARLRAEGFRAGRGGADATAFYAARRAEMDEGARVAWPERHNPDELSALQHAMNLRIDDPETFEAEYQNAPRPLVQEEPGELSASQVAGRLSRVPRGRCPPGAARLTGFIDVQQDLLYWAVGAFEDDFTGAVIDYGVYPPQGRDYFTLADARPTLSQATGIGSVEGSIHEGLARLTNDLCGREWPAEGAAGLRLERLLIDSGWQPDVVYRFARQSPHAAVLTPSKGYAIGAGANPVSEWPRKPGERRGAEWVLRLAQPPRPRLLLYDANWWKSALFARLAQPAGERGGLALWGGDPAAHRLFADHLKAEYRVRTEGRGRKVSEWKWRPGRPDNHWLDCAVGALVAASFQGCAPRLAGAAEAPGRPRESWAAMQRRKREERRRGR